VNRNRGSPDSRFRLEVIYQSVHAYMESIRGLVHVAEKIRISKAERILYERTSEDRWVVRNTAQPHGEYPECSVYDV